MCYSLSFYLKFVQSIHLFKSMSIGSSSLVSLGESDQSMGSSCLVSNGPNNPDLVGVVGGAIIPASMGWVVVGGGPKPPNPVELVGSGVVASPNPHGGVVVASPNPNPHGADAFGRPSDPNFSGVPHGAEVVGSGPNFVGGKVTRLYPQYIGRFVALLVSRPSNRARVNSDLGYSIPLRNFMMTFETSTKTSPFIASHVQSATLYPIIMSPVLLCSHNVSGVLQKDQRVWRYAINDVTLRRQ